MKWSEYFPHRLLQVKLLKCEVELMPKDRRKEALKMRKYQLRNKHRWTISKGNPGSQLYMFIHQDIAIDSSIGELGI